MADLPTAPDGPVSAPASSAAERALVARLLAGDEAAFVELVGRHHAPLRRLARVFVSSDASAEELVQETWVAVLDGLRGFEARASLKTWIFRILVNRAKTRREREARTTPLSALAPDAGAGDDDSGPAVDPARFDERGRWTAPPQHGSPEQALLDGETRARLAEAVAALPERQRALVVLRDIDGLTAEEACNVLGLSESNQRVLLHRARSRLRAELEQWMKR
ncbi:MAG: sigma-70 family RNA polymerase sigma factor [Deltaproteobacteria bacterium]|nr:sigma-70 family RNA polymerase sigma factor [Deltaproteobacteria bacterium]